MNDVIKLYIAVVLSHVLHLCEDWKNEEAYGKLEEERRRGEKKIHYNHKQNKNIESSDLH